MDSVARSASISVEADRNRRILRHDKREKDKEAPRREAADTTWEWEPTKGPIAIAEVAPIPSLGGGVVRGHHHLCTAQTPHPPIAEMKWDSFGMEA